MNFFIDRLMSEYIEFGICDHCRKLKNIVSSFTSSSGERFGFCVNCKEELDKI